MYDNMKRILNASLLLLALWGAAACSMDKLGGSEDPVDKVEGEQIGYLAIGSLSVNTDTESAEVGSPRTVSRAGNVDTQEFEITLTDVAGNIVEPTLENGTKLATPFTLRDLTANGSRLYLALRPGTYTVTAHSKGSDPDAPSEQPWFAGAQTVTVESAQNDRSKAVTANIVCKLTRIRVTAEISADLRRFFKQEGVADADLPGTTVRISHPSNADLSSEYRFPLSASHYDEGIYFKDCAGPANDRGNVMQITLKGLFSVDPETADADDSWQPIEQTYTVTGVKAATYRDIRISIDYGTEGNLEFTVTIDSYVYDEELETDAASSLTGMLEPTIPDDSDPETPPQGGDEPEEPTEKGPKIELIDNDIDRWHYLTGGAYDTRVRLSSESGLTDISVIIRSEMLNDDELKGLDLASEMDVFNPATAAMESGLRSLGFLPIEAEIREGESRDSYAYADDNLRIFDPATGERKPGAVSPLMNAKEVVFDITEFTGLLYVLYESSGATGDCIFELTAIDQEGNETTKSLKFRIE